MAKKRNGDMEKSESVQIKEIQAGKSIQSCILPGEFM
jgi:hypothetical protein